MSRANVHIKEKYDLHSRLLLELNIGENVICQNTRTKAWDRSGTIVSQLAYRQYMVQMDGRAAIATQQEALKKINCE